MSPPGNGEAGPALQTRPGNHTTERPAENTPVQSILPDPLVVARQLIALGVPVFAAQPALDRDGNWDSAGGHGGCGYWLPPQWEKTWPTQNWLDPTAPGFEHKAWRPGYALCAVMGRGLDALDCDPRNGGEVSRAELIEAGVLPTVYAAATTPSGGTHEFVASLGVGSLDGFRPGLDLKGGKPDGSSRGFVFLAPTVKCSKTSGELGTYAWADVRLDEVDPDDESGKALGEIVRPPAKPLPPVTTPARAEGDPRLTAYARRAWEGEVARLTGMAEAAVPEGRTYGGGPWDATTFEVACNLLELANAAWSPYSVADACGAVMQHAPRDPGFTDTDVTRKFRSALDTVGDRPRPAPAEPVSAAEIAAWDIPAEKPSQAAESKQQGISAAFVIEFVEGHYAVACTPAGEAFAVARRGPRLPLLLGERGGSLRDVVTAQVYDELGKVPGTKALDEGLRVVIARARQSPTTVPLHLRVAAHDGGLVIDLGQHGSSACVVVTARGWTVQPHPPTGVLFRRTAATRPLPTPVVGGSLEPLRRLLGLDAALWDLARGWLVAAMVPGIARPLLGLIGSPGSAKTSRGRLLLCVVDPRDELGSNFGKNLSDDQSKALGRYLLGYDNLTAVSEAVSDHVCRVVTGDEIDKRRLYSDNELVVVSYRRTGVVTAVSLPPLRPDALERVIPLHLERLPEADRRSEAELKAAFDAAHGEILGGLCDALVGMLARLPKVRAERVDRPRMADYFDAVRAYDPAAAEAYRRGASQVMVDAAEADPFVGTVQAWLAEQGMPWIGTAKKAYEAASAYRGQAGLWSSAWWPSSPSAFSAALSKASEPLRAVGIEVVSTRWNGERRKTFRAVSAGSATR